VETIRLDRQKVDGVKESTESFMAYLQMVLRFKSRSAATTPVTQNTMAATQLTTGAAPFSDEVMQMALTQYLATASGKRTLTEMLGMQANPKEAADNAAAAADDDEVKQPPNKKQCL